MSLGPLKERIGAINDLLTTVNLLVWDSRTMMPAGAAAARGRQVATLTRLARDLACDDDMVRRLEAAERAVAVVGRGRDRSRRRSPGARCGRCASAHPGGDGGASGQAADDPCIPALGISA